MYRARVASSSSGSRLGGVGSALSGFAKVLEFAAIVFASGLVADGSNRSAEKTARPRGALGRAEVSAIPSSTLRKVLSTLWVPRSADAPHTCWHDDFPSEPSTTRAKHVLGTALAVPGGLPCRFASGWRFRLGGDMEARTGPARGEQAAGVCGLCLSRRSGCVGNGREGVRMGWRCRLSWSWLTR